MIEPQLSERKAWAHPENLKGNFYVYLYRGLLWLGSILGHTVQQAGDLWSEGKASFPSPENTKLWTSAPRANQLCGFGSPRG